MKNSTKIGNFCIMEFDLGLLTKFGGARKYDRFFLSKKKPNGLMKKERNKDKIHVFKATFLKK